MPQMAAPTFTHFPPQKIDSLALRLEPELPWNTAHHAHDTNQPNVTRYPHPALRRSLRGRGERERRPDARLDPRPEELGCYRAVVLSDPPAHLQS